MTQGSVADGKAHRDPVVEPSKPRLLSVLGPGLITGAADDDPNGSATYSQTGVHFGYGTVWTMPFCFPLMAAVQIPMLVAHSLPGSPIIQHFLTKGGALQ
jgi:hypothetical protein